MALPRRTRQQMTDAATYAVLGVASVVALGPILWGLATSFKTSAGVVAMPPQWLPAPVTFENYRLVLLNSSLPRCFLNSLVVALCGVTLTLAVGCHAGYAAARFTFPGKNGLLLMILATAMIPGISIMAPLYLVATKVGLHDTYWIQILIYSAWQVPSIVWLIRGFFESVPPDLEEAAMIDGCSRLRAFYHIVLPIAQPGLAAAAILVFVYIWNDFLIGAAFTVTEHMRPMQVGLYLFIRDSGVEWGRFMAYTMIGLIPIIGLFVALQRRFIQGLAAGATKG
ncbi:MAG TPA: carbohydrate ABC transporter permease [Candidatus Acidoferrum sp.]|nr:carbohydrate ABC transporter permease [Candidatus Methylomirabilis sp.]HWU37554.1 carbohydrate ABC transporter permease [Candidatus Acidoferrum sp.]